MSYPKDNKKRYTFIDDMNILTNNPLRDDAKTVKTSEPCVLVIFGATGDLTSRKLIPAIYNLVKDGELPPHFACVGFARRPKDHEQFRKEMHDAINQFSRTKPIDEKIWENFKDQLFYHCSEFDDDAGYESLRKFLDDIDAKYDTRKNRVYYLSTPPKYFPLITQKLKEHHLIYDEHEENHWSRVIIEKPFGHDLQSAKVLQHELAKCLSENQIYRIDHYLGKETVQNLLVFRFSNPFFESIWNNHHIDHVQITVAEEIGIGTRGHFFEEAGILRDIVQNHMMQLLSLVAMEPPSNLGAHAIRNEKVKVMQAVQEFPWDQIERSIIRGQYGKGYINGEPVLGYREENNVSPASTVETFAAMKMYIDNWRWTGVPFYLRAGKRLPKRTTEIAISFKDVPGILFSTVGKHIEKNVLVIRIQPDEGISLKVNCKVPGMSETIQPVKMDFLYGSYFGSTPPEAYEKLICDCMSGDNTLFAHIDEVTASWRVFDPILRQWEQDTTIIFPNYHSGSWGPEDAEHLIIKDGRRWRLL